MKNPDDKLEHLAEKLRRHKPELQDAELLTDNIMQQISINTSSSKPKLLIWIRIISSSAAIFLFGLFLFQQTGTESIASTYKSKPLFENRFNIDPNCIKMQENNQVNLIKSYLCYMQQNSIKNKQLRSLAQLLNN